MPLSYTVVGIRCIHMSVIIYSQMNATSKHLSHMHFIQQQNNSYWHECAASTTSRHMIICVKLQLLWEIWVDNYNYNIKTKTINNVCTSVFYSFGNNAICQKSIFIRSNIDKLLGRDPLFICCFFYYYKSFPFFFFLISWEFLRISFVIFKRGIYNSNYTSKKTGNSSYIIIGITWALNGI